MSSNFRIHIAAFISWILSLTAITLIVYWMVHFYDGYKVGKWQYKDSRVFNYHPLFMTIGLIFLAPTGAAVYRLSPDYISKFWQKIVHFLIQFIALIFASVGFAAVLKFHSDFGYKDFIDVHSWCGLATFVLFALQLIGGFVSFLFPRLPDGPRENVAIWHAISGKIIVLLAILTAINGVARRNNRTGQLTHEQKVVNSLTVVLYVLFAVVYYMLAERRYPGSHGFGRLT